MSEEKINKKIVFILVISLLVAILDETHQIFVPFRDAGIKDIMIDFSGSMLAMILFSLMNKRSGDKI